MKDIFGQILLPEILSIVLYEHERFQCISLYFLGLESEPEHMPPTPEEKPPQIMKPITNTLVVEGSPAKFTAEYSGQPQPDVTWLRNALQVLQETRNIKVGITLKHQTWNLYRL